MTENTPEASVAEALAESRVHDALAGTKDTLKEEVLRTLGDEVTPELSKITAVVFRLAQEHNVEPYTIAQHAAGVLMASARKVRSTER
jgi:hypothetical protein